MKSFYIIKSKVKVKMENAEIEYAASKLVGMMNYTDPPPQEEGVLFIITKLYDVPQDVIDQVTKGNHQGLHKYHKSHKIHVMKFRRQNPTSKTFTEKMASKK